MKLKLFILAIFCVLISNAQTTTVNMSWANGFGSANNEDSYQSTIDANGNVYITGRITGTVDFAPGPLVNNLYGFQQCFIAKYDPAGALVWAKVMEDISGSSFGSVIGVDAFGNVLVSGYFSGTVDVDPGPATASVAAMGSADLFLSKFDINGSMVWNRVIGSPSNQVNAFDMKVTSAGDIFVTGDFDGTADFDASGNTYTLTSVGFKDVFAMKYDAAGLFQWAIGFGGSINDDQGVGIDVDPTGNVYLSGHFQGDVDFDPSIGGVTSYTSSGMEDIFLAKFTPTGGLVWVDQMGGTAKDQGYRVDYTQGGEVVISGIMQSVDFDGDPSPSVFTVNKVGTSQNNTFLGKYNSTTGALIWAKATGGSGFVGIGAYSMTSDLQNNIYLCGFFDGTADFDFSPSVNTLTAVTSGGSSPDIFFAKYDNAGNYIFAKNIGGGTGSGNEAYWLNVSPSNEIILTGNFGGTPDFDVSGAVYTQTTNGGTDFFIAKYTQCIDPTTATLAVNATTLCGTTNTITLTVSAGTLNSATNWVWYNVSCGTGSIATGTSVAVNPSVTTEYFIRGEGGCIVSGPCVTASITVLPYKHISGQVTSSATPVAGKVALYKYEGGFTKYDSLTNQTIDVLGNFTFTSVATGSYILMAVPSATNLQTTYAGSAISWKGATVLTHGCITNLNQNINVVPLTNLGNGPGVLAGQIVEGLKYGQKGTVVPGGPIKGISVKCGRNPGGDIIAQGRTNPAGGYTLSNLPENAMGESYFLLVDIPGLDTNGTYHKIITPGVSVYDNLNFVVDSAKITPGVYVGLNELNENKNIISFYPNPTKGLMHMNFEFNTDLKVEVYNVSGQLQISQYVTKKENQIDFSELIDGVYYIRSYSNNQLISINKLIKISE